MEYRDGFWIGGDPDPVPIVLQNQRSVLPVGYDGFCPPQTRSGEFHAREASLCPVPCQQKLPPLRLLVFADFRQNPASRLGGELIAFSGDLRGSRHALTQRGVRVRKIHDHGEIVGQLLPHPLELLRLGHGAIRCCGREDLLDAARVRTFT